jgi:hypothetical protein
VQAGGIPVLTKKRENREHNSIQKVFPEKDTTRPQTHEEGREALYFTVSGEAMP